MLNGSLPEDEQEGSFELSERGACPEEQLVSTSLYPNFPAPAAFCTALPLLHNNNADILHSDHHPKPSGPECGRKSRSEG